MLAVKPARAWSPLSHETVPRKSLNPARGSEVKSGVDPSQKSLSLAMPAPNSNAPKASQKDVHQAESAQQASPR